MTWTAQVIEGASWLSITSGSSGTNAGTINVEFETNTWTARTGKIVIKAPWADIQSDTVEVRQPVAEYYIVVPSDTLNAGDDSCMAAKRTITVPWACGRYLVSNNASLTLIAGDTIRLKPGFHAENGSYFNAFISDLPCVLKTPPLVADEINIDRDEVKLFEVFPNPATETITIAHTGKPCDKDLYIEIYNSQGKPVFWEGLQWQNQWEINISVLSAGLYFVKAWCGDDVYIRKIVKH
jgi:hypothetical protein